MTKILEGYHEQLLFEVKISTQTMTQSKQAACHLNHEIQIFHLNPVLFQEIKKQEFYKGCPDLFGIALVSFWTENPLLW